ncbi:polyprenyl synthetase family protein [Gammaproteobacteria bacterium]|nr:polyprenyl synthetase family protein [Gammaproteobacteria bacterium]
MSARQIDPFVLDGYSQTIRSELLNISKLTDVPMLQDLCDYFLGSGGKHLRGALLMWINDLGPQPSTHAKDLAVIVELIHAATLLHDDVVDSSKKRRNQMTAHEKWGNTASILSGDYLYALAFKKISGLNDLYVIRLLADATTTIVEGEIKQLTYQNQLIDTKTYFELIHAKTAKLFELSTHIGAYLAGFTAHQYQALAEFGQQLGLAFQIIDDWLDYQPQILPDKNAGDDLRDHKATLPWILAYQQANNDDKKTLEQALKRGSEKDFVAVTSILAKTQALDKSHLQAQQIINQAKSIFNDLLPHHQMQLEQICQRILN